MWEWRLSDIPSHCERCEKSHAKKETIPPCSECNCEPPILSRANFLFDEVYSIAGKARDGNGALQYTVLISMMDYLDIPKSLRSDLVENAILIEPLIQKRSAELLKRERDNDKGK